MSMLPIDVTITVSRTPEITRSQAGEQARPEVTHQQFADRLNREVQLQDQRVLHTNRSEQNTVNPDGRGGGAYGKRKNNKGKGKTEEKSKPLTNGGGMLDISI